MRKILPILVLATAVYLTPLYPVYAQTYTTTSQVTTESTPGGNLKARGVVGQIKKEMVSDQIMARKDKIASRAAQLQEKLQKFRDKNKAKRVENINNSLNNVNSNITAQMQQNLARISEVVTKLKSWIAEQEAAGKDVSALKTTLTDIETKWTDANMAVTGQAENDYTVTVNAESTVRTDVQTARDDLRSDLNSVHDKIESVKQSLISAFTSWKGTTNGQ